MRDVIVIIGRGLLAELVYKELSDEYNPVRRRSLHSVLPKTAKIGLVLNEEYRLSDHLEAEKVMGQAGIPWLSGTVHLGEGMIGPLVRPGIPGCSQCAQRRMNNGMRKEDHAVSRVGWTQMTGLIVSEVRKFLQGVPANTEGRLYLLDFQTLNSSLHSFLPDPLCKICGELPVDSPEAARISLQASPKLGSETYRCKSVEGLADLLLQDYRNERTGLINTRMTDPLSPFCDVLVRLPTVFGDEITAGRSHSYKQSELTALLEGLERYCGIMPRGKRTSMNDSYQNLKDHALNPITVGLYSPEQYSSPDFLFEPFDANAPMNWVWGYSLMQERPMLIPEQLAYYSAGFGGSFVSEGSNGCALGGSIEEAIFYGIMEVVERDSFLMTWYAQMPVPRLDPYSAHDSELLLMIQRLEAVTGYELFLFNMTMETGIPSIWVLAKNRKETGANLVCAAGAHLDPIRAAKSALFELAGHAKYLDEMFELNREEYVQMLKDPDLVSEMPDHALLYTVPEAEERLRFLLDGNRPLRNFADEFKPRVWHSDLTEDLKAILQEFRRFNLDVLVVDQTGPETKRNGLYCVKVIIPGMLPMTFGHHLRRLTGLERLLSVPKALGFTPNDLNPHPHPFL